MRNQPLKSIVQTSFGAAAPDSGCVHGALLRRRRGARVSPASRSQSPMVLAAGSATCGHSSASFTRSLRGPHVGVRPRSASAEETSASGRARP